ncbi:hypothetical protein BMS3Abin05_02195 [bacterium BMS3Abin05]|nr:hypothetical protein BMS3Abin05_02195 [bacterium BMS3Abin05]
MIFFKLLELGGNRLARHFRLYGNFFRADGIPTQSDEINNFLLLRRQFIHAVLIQRCDIIENLFEVQESAAVAVVHKNVKKNNNRADDAAGNAPQRLHAAGLVLNNFFDAFPLIAFTQFQQQRFCVRGCQSAQGRYLEKLVKRLAVIVMKFQAHG